MPFMIFFHWINSR